MRNVEPHSLLIKAEGAALFLWREGMKKAEVFAWVKEMYGIEPDYPWADGNGVLRHPENNKWFALVMEVRKDKIGLSEDGTADVINVKCDPVLVGSLRERAGFYPAYHMNKDKWITIRLDGGVDGEEIQRLIQLSYELTAPVKKKKRKL